MTTAELLAALARECPNGVSFDPMAVRLLRRKLPLENWQIRNLQADMFQLENGIWFSIEMISNDEARLALREQARTWLIELGYFSVERLFNNFCTVLSHIATPEDFAAFLRHLGFLVAKGRKGHLFCLQSSTSLDEYLGAWVTTRFWRKGKKYGLNGLSICIDVGYTWPKDLQIGAAHGQYRVQAVRYRCWIPVASFVGRFPGA